MLAASRYWNLKASKAFDFSVKKLKSLKDKHCLGVKTKTQSIFILKQCNVSLLLMLTE